MAQPEAGTANGRKSHLKAKAKVLRCCTPKLTREQKKARYRKLADRMIHLRESRGDTIEALAQATGLTVPQIKRIERGQSDSSIAHLYVIAEHYETTLARVCDGL